MRIVRRKRSSTAIVGLAASVVVAAALIAVTRSRGDQHMMPLQVGQASQPASSPPKAFIVPDDQMGPPDASAPAMPRAYSQEKDGPRSRALAKEIAPSLPGSFRVIAASDTADFDAGVVVFEAPEGRLVVNAQTLPRPVPTSSVVNMSLTPDVAPIPLPSYEHRADGSVIVSLTETGGTGTVVAIAKLDGTFVRLESLGNNDPGAPAPVQVPELRRLALRHLGLS